MTHALPSPTQSFRCPSGVGPAQDAALSFFAHSLSPVVRAACQKSMRMAECERNRAREERGRREARLDCSTRGRRRETRHPLSFSMEEWDVRALVCSCVCVTLSIFV